MMTEDEAKTKWCPFSDVADATPAQAIVPATRCIGSACMAWRWQDVSGPYASVNEAMEEPPYGYCGLAGRPT
jgi:hypothetical protein